MRHLKHLLLTTLFTASCLTVAQASTVNYTYDDLGRLIEVKYDGDKTVKYEYDAAGNRTSHVVSGSGLGQDPNGGGVIVLPLSGFIVIPLPGSVVGN